MASHSSASMIPGRSGLRQRAADPRAGCYERGRARDAYRKQMNIFKARLEASLREHDRLDPDAKQEVRIKAKRQRQVCLRDYRDGLQGLARSSQRRTYQDVFLGQLETNVDVYDANVLEYELRLTSEMDTLIDNIRLLNADKSNLSKLDWFANLAKAKFSYQYELADEPDPDSFREPSAYQPDPDGERDEYLDLGDSASVADSTGYVYRPYSCRRNLYDGEFESEPPTASPADWRRLYQPAATTTSSRLSSLARDSEADAYDYEPFQPFQDVPMRRRRPRYPEATRDAEWASTSAVFAHHRPSPGRQQYAPSRFDLNLDSICPTYQAGPADEPLAGLDYEYKPIIPSYRLNGGEHADSRFQYQDEDEAPQNDRETNQELPTAVPSD